MRDRGVVIVAVMALLLAGCSGSSADESVGEPASLSADQSVDQSVDQPVDGPTDGDPGDPSTEDDAGDPAEQLHPDVLDATFSLRDDGAFDMSVTLSSPYDTPERYADAWRVRTVDGEVLGVRELTHDHANEQPFTRQLRDVEIPNDVLVVLVDGRDQQNGWGQAVEFTVPERP